MIDQFEVERRWEHRNEYIVIAGIALFENEIKYIIQVITNCSMLNKYEWYMFTSTVLKRCLQYKDKNLTPEDAAKKILQENRELMEVA